MDDQFEKIGINMKTQKILPCWGKLPLLPAFSWNSPCWILNVTWRCWVLLQILEVLLRWSSPHGQLLWGFYKRESLKWLDTLGGGGWGPPPKEVVVVSGKVFDQDRSFFNSLETSCMEGRSGFTEWRLPAEPTAAVTAAASCEEAVFAWTWRKAPSSLFLLQSAWADEWRQTWLTVAPESNSSKWSFGYMYFF